MFDSKDGYTVVGSDLTASIVLGCRSPPVTKTLACYKHKEIVANKFL
jgi:hypothetical protein